MKTNLLSLSAVCVALLAACGGSEEPATSVASTPDAPQNAAQPAATQPAAELPTAPTGPSPAAGPQGQVQSVSRGNRWSAPMTAEESQLKSGPRTAVELVMPFAISETERHMAGPYPEDLTIDTPLVVRGRTIPSDDVRRMLIMGVGFAQSEYRKFQLILEDELDRRQQQGEDISKYLVSDAELEEYLTTQRDDFAEKYPTLDFENEVGRAYGSYEVYLEPARQSLLFDRVFIPDNPADWPALSIEVLRGFGGEPFVKDAFDSYARRKEQMDSQGLDKLPPDDPIIVGTWRDLVVRALSEFSVIVTDPEQLAPGVLMKVDGRDILIDTIWTTIEPNITKFELAKVRRMLVMMELLEADLESRGELLSKADFLKTWVPSGQTYRQYLEVQSSRAGNLFGNISKDAYARYCRILESLRLARPDDVASLPEQRDFLSAINLISGAAKCDIEVILSSAWDGDAVAWKENGWEQAREASLDLKRQLDAGGDWKSLRELHSQFWDPPLPEVGQKPQFGFHFKGAFGSQTRNQLCGLLTEAQSEDLIFGALLANRVFYEQEVGTVIGPLMGPKGYYIIRLTGRTPIMAQLNLAEPTHLYFAESYFLRDMAMRRAHELALASAAEGVIEGL